MAASPATVAVGTRGSVGSLVKKEMEYFSKFELETHEGTKKPQPHTSGMVSCRSYSRHGFWVLIMAWKRRKRRCTSWFLPKICSVAEVAESNDQLSRIPGYNYRILKNKIDDFQP